MLYSLHSFLTLLQETNAVNPQKAKITATIRIVLNAFIIVSLKCFHKCNQRKAVYVIRVCYKFVNIIETINQDLELFNLITYRLHRSHEATPFYLVPQVTETAKPFKLCLPSNPQPLAQQS